MKLVILIFGLSIIPGCKKSTVLSKAERSVEYEIIQTYIRDGYDVVTAQLQKTTTIGYFTDGLVFGTSNPEADFVRTKNTLDNSLVRMHFGQLKIDKQLIVKTDNLPSSVPVIWFERFRSSQNGNGENSFIGTLLSSAAISGEKRVWVLNAISFDEPTVHLQDFPLSLTAEL